MKQAALLALPVLALASLGACTPDTRSSGAEPPPYKAPTGSLSGTPQSPNSLPDGAAVNSPITPATGMVGTTTVSPPTGTAAPARRRVP